MKDKRCFICKYQGKMNVDTSSNELYGQRDKTLSILLCYTHSVELFKTGQTNFMQKYRPNFIGFYGMEDDKNAMNFFNFRS
jgi:hypothetical protein